MGRRKQANPSRVDPTSDEIALATSSTSPSTTTSSSASLPSSTPPPKHSPLNGYTATPNGPSASKKPKTDFSIKSHLDSSTSASKFNPSLSPHSLSNALKAYETLLNELNRQPNGLKPGPLLQLTKQVDKLASRDGKRDPATETALDLRVKKPSSSTTSSSSRSSTPKHSSSQSDNTDSLRKLSSLVGKAGTSMNASMAAVVKSPANLTHKEDNDPCKIFTCLQCFERFPGMQELVDHMSKTKHHFNQTVTSTKPSTTSAATTSAATNGFLDPHSLLRQSLLSSQKI